MTDAKAVDMGKDINLDPNAKGAAKAPAPVDLEVDGKKFSVPPEVAAALSAAQKAATDAGVASKDTEAALRKEIEAIQAKLPKDSAKDAPNPDDYDTLLFTNPKAAIQRIKDEVKADLQAQSAVKDAQVGFWSAFYEEHPELKEDDLVVKAVMSRDMEDLRPLKVAEAIKKLGSATQKYLLDRGVKREKTKKGDKMEGGNEKSPKKSDSSNVSGDSPTTGGITAVLKDRAAARRAARAGASASA